MKLIWIIPWLLLRSAQARAPLLSVCLWATMILLWITLDRFHCGHTNVKSASRNEILLARFPKDRGPAHAPEENKNMLGFVKFRWEKYCNNKAAVSTIHWGEFLLVRYWFMRKSHLRNIYRIYSAPSGTSTLNLQKHSSCQVTGVRYNAQDNSRTKSAS